MGQRKLADVVAEYLGWRPPSKEAELKHEKRELLKAAEQTKSAAGALIHTVKNYEQRQNAYMRMLAESFDDVEDRLRRRR